MDLQNKTLSVLSLYNKRSYSIPKSFENGIYAYVIDIFRSSGRVKNINLIKDWF